MLGDPDLSCVWGGGREKKRCETNRWDERETHALYYYGELFVVNNTKLDAPIYKKHLHLSVDLSVVYDCDRMSLCYRV